MGTDIYADFDLKGFWKDNQESQDDFICKEATPEDIYACEKQLGFTLPASYIALMRGHNGGLLGRMVFQKKDTNGRVLKSVICEFLNAIGSEKSFSLLADWSKWHDKEYTWGILIGLHMPNSGFPTQFYLDYELCGHQGEPRVICRTGVWNTKKNCAEPAQTELAPTFEIFAKNLTKAPKILPFDFDAFQIQLEKIAQKNFTEIVKKHEPEKINAFGFYTDDNASFLASAANTKANLTKLTTESPSEKEFFTYSTTNWKYQGESDIQSLHELSDMLQEYSALLFSDAKIKNFRNKIVNSCVHVLENLKRDGFFTKLCHCEVTLMVNLTLDNLPQTTYKKIITRLND